MRQQRHLLLLVSIAALFVVAPTIAHLKHGIFYLNLLGAAVVGTGTFALINRRGVFTVGVLLSLLSVTATAWLIAAPTHGSILYSHITIVALVGFFVCAILRYVFQGGRVTGDRIYAAVSVYMLIGFTWAYVYALIDELQPGSFNGLTASTTDSHIQRVLQLRYYSFITLTTVGYGDITPRSEAARTMAALEAVVGQIYLTVLVARLVGLHIAHATTSRETE